MNYNNVSDELEMIHDDFNYEITENIEEILGNDVSEQMKSELLDSLWSIFIQKRRIRKNNVIPNYNSNQQIPRLNLFFLSTPFSPLPQQPLLQQQSIPQPLLQQQQQPIAQPYNFQPVTYPMNSFFAPQQPYQLPIFNITSKSLQKKKNNKKIKKHKKDEKSKKKEKKQKKSKTDKKPDESKITQLPYNLGKKFDRIINYLNKKSGGNAHTNNTIQITSNSKSQDSFGNNDLTYIIDYHFECNYYQSGEDENTFICFDFKNRRVNITNYTIRSMNTINGAYQLKNWVIEVSNDGLNWIEIDNRKNNNSLKQANTIVSFEIKTKNENFYRYARLRQTGEGWSNGSNKYTIGLKMIEFYGSIYEP